MNEELINQIVSRILSEPAFKELLQGTKAGSFEELKMVKLDGLVLLNYVPEFDQVLTAVKKHFGEDYTLSILPSDQVLVAKPTLLEGMTWITPQDALSKTTWQKIIIPTCSPNTLAKVALGLRDNPISEMIGRGITQGIPTLLVTDYLGFTAKTPKAYRALYEGYLQTVQSYGVVVSATLGDDCTKIEDMNRAKSISRGPVTDQKTVLSAQGQAITEVSPYSRTNPSEQNAPLREEIRFDQKFLGEKQVFGIPEGSRVLVKRGTVISPLARDTMKSRRIELRQEMEGGRR